MDWRTIRAWTYRVSAVLGFLYVVVGVLTGQASYDDVTAAFGTLLAALAAANTPTKGVTDVASE